MADDIDDDRAVQGRGILLVGECNPYGVDPDFALYPLPERATGHRLQSLVMGLSRGEYLRRFDRVNLCTGKWSMKAAQAEADRICREENYEIFVLLGRKVTKAFLPGEPEPFSVQEHCSGRFVILPHPSGLCREWHKPGAFERARKLLEEAGVLGSKP